MANINKITGVDKQKIQEAYLLKYKEYSEKFKDSTLDDIKKYYEECNKNKKTRIGGVYKKALLEVISEKLQNEAIKSSISTETNNTESNLENNTKE